MSYLRGPLTRDHIRTLTAGARPPPSADTPVPATPARRALRRPCVAAGDRPVLRAGRGRGSDLFSAADRRRQPRVFERTLPGRGRAQDALYRRDRRRPGRRRLGQGRSPSTWRSKRCARTRYPAPRSRSYRARRPRPSITPDGSATSSAGCARTRPSRCTATSASGSRPTRAKPRAISACGCRRWPARERDQEIAKLRKRYAGKATTLENRLLRAEQAIAREQEQASKKTLDTAVSIGTAILGAVLGRKRLSTTSASRVGTAIKTAGSARKEAADVARAQQTAEKGSRRSRGARSAAGEGGRCARHGIRCAGRRVSTRSSFARRPRTFTCR